VIILLFLWSVIRQTAIMFSCVLALIIPIFIVGSVTDGFWALVLGLFLGVFTTIVWAEGLHKLKLL
jgi:hypothetical protein